jgi:glutathione S-transferase
MELRYGTLSPYVRKVRVVAEELGIADRIKLVLTNTREKPEEIVPLNPLGKIPTLVTDSGAVLFDSPVICEYLDAEFGSHRFLPASGPKRWEIMTAVALADGIIDSAIMSRQEKARPEAQQSAESIDWQWRKIKAGLDRFESTAGSLGELHMGLITLGCALGYIAVRLPDFPLYDGRTKLKGWFAKVSERPSFQNTAPKM